MPKARNRFERARQALAWLLHEYPCGRPVRIRWRKEIKDKKGQYFGETRREGSEIVVYLSKRLCRTWFLTVDTLIHEYVHGRQWPLARIEEHPRCGHHPPAFWAEEGEIKDRWYHDHGNEQANDFTF